MGASDKIFGRFIPREHVGEAASWEFQPLAAGAGGGGPGAMLTERERRAFQRGLEQGRQEGRAAGLAAAREQSARRGEQLDQVLQALRARFAELEADGADALLDLALAVARQVLRREIPVARDAVLPALREAVALVIDQHAHPRVHLHPEDYELLRGELEADGMLKGCRFIADASVTRGGCRVETAQLDVDATVQTRWRRVVAALGVDADAFDRAREPWRDAAVATDAGTSAAPTAADATARADALPPSPAEG